MSIPRRSFLTGLAGILASGVAPAAVGSSVLMPVRKIVRAYRVPEYIEFEWHPDIGVIERYNMAQQAEIARVFRVPPEFLTVRHPGEAIYPRLR